MVYCRYTNTRYTKILKIVKLCTGIVWWIKVKIITCTNSSVHAHVQCTFCTMYVQWFTFVRLGVIFSISLRQEWHVKIKAKCYNFLVKVSQMTRVPQFENHCCTEYVISHVQYTSIFVALTLNLRLCTDR